MCTFLGQNKTVLQFGPNLKFRKQKGLKSRIQIVHIFILTPCGRKIRKVFGIPSSGVWPTWDAGAQRHYGYGRHLVPHSAITAKVRGNVSNHSRQHSDAAYWQQERDPAPEHAF